MTFFDILRSILTKTNPDLYKSYGFTSIFNSYMLVRYLSMEPDLLPFAEIIEKFNAIGISKEDIYIWAFKHIPKHSGYIKYISKPKDKK